ncbi:MAG: M13 family metallopeptidase [Saprospiraceae bacterium]|nr:M13 family metallopeptidase [Saprospiraceae bacterium]
MRILSGIALFILLTLLGSGCAKKNGSPISLLDLAGMDSLVQPGDDFFTFVNGIWLDTVQIPATQVGAGSFFDLQNKSENALKKICEAAAATRNTTRGSLEQMVGDMYASIMDTVSIESRGYSPLAPTFHDLENISNIQEMMHFVAKEKINGNDLLFGFGIGPDDKNASVNITGFSQSGLGLPDRDYYFRDDRAAKEILSAYTKYLTKVFILIDGDSSSAARDAQKVMEVEKRLATGHYTNVELRDPERNYHKLELSELNRLTPNIDWQTLCNDLLIRTDTILVSQLTFFITLDKLLVDIPLNEWKLYLKAGTVGNSSQSLTKELADASFEFYNKTLSGQQKRKARWQYGVTTVDARIGDLVGQLYVKENFDENAKSKMMEMIDNLQLAYGKRIASLDWMSDTTKEKALGKLNTIIRKIGYPEKWKSYDTLSISREDYFQNQINTSRYEFFRNVAKNGQPVDRFEWPFTPPTVNAYYNATTNEIMFLAGILQPPFFYPDGDDAINYGAIEMVIGHEFTHGFDDQGRDYDQEGNLKDWWQSEDAEQFTAKAKLVGEQYASYIPIDTLHLNPELTMGENLADIGGLAIAYHAFKMTPQGKGNQKLDGLTPDQRFFVAFAEIWRIKIKDELMRQLVLTDVHSPAKFRINGPLTNFSPFYDAFGLTMQNAMWKPEKERIRIW